MGQNGDRVSNKMGEVVSGSSDNRVSNKMGEVVSGSKW